MHIIRFKGSLVQQYNLFSLSLQVRLPNVTVSPREVSSPYFEQLDLLMTVESLLLQR